MFPWESGETKTVPKVECSHIEIEACPHIASVGYDPDSATLEIDWKSDEADFNVAPAVTRRRYRAVSSYSFAKIICADETVMAQVAATELRGAVGVVVQC